MFRVDFSFSSQAGLGVHFFCLPSRLQRGAAHSVNSAWCRAYRERVAVQRRQPLCRAAPIGSRSIFAALGGGSYARASHVNSNNPKILQNHVSVSIRESHHGVKLQYVQAERLCIVNRPRRRGAGRCHAAQPRLVNRLTDFGENLFWLFRIQGRIQELTTQGIISKYLLSVTSGD